MAALGTCMCMCVFVRKWVNVGSVGANDEEHFSEKST